MSTRAAPGSPSSRALRAGSARPPSNAFFRPEPLRPGPGFPETARRRGGPFLSQVLRRLLAGFARPAPGSGVAGLVSTGATIVDAFGEGFGDIVVREGRTVEGGDALGATGEPFLGAIARYVML